MKRFEDFLKEFENENQAIDERVFDGGRANPESHSKSKPVFANGVNEDVGGMTAPSVPTGPGGAPSGILAPGSDAVMPTVINGNAPSHCCHCHHGPGHRPPPPPPPFRRYLGFVSPFGRVIVSRKKKSKKSKKSKKNSSKRKPKNPY